MRREEARLGVGVRLELAAEARPEKRTTVEMRLMESFMAERKERKAQKNGMRKCKHEGPLLRCLATIARLGTRDRRTDKGNRMERNSDCPWHSHGECFRFEFQHPFGMPMNYEYSISVWTPDG
jgi:hypothetical protein